MPHDVFISFSSLNKADADAAVACLEREKIACWIAHRDNPKGSAFGGSTDNAIVECKLFVVLVSRASAESKDVESELEAANRLNKLIIPVFIENVEPSGFMRDYVATRETFNLTDKQPSLLARIRRQLNPASAANDPGPPPSPFTGDADPTRAPADSLPKTPRLVSPVFRPDDSVGRYQIVRLIGRGGMGMVYEAMQVNPKRRVALKVMDPTLASSGAIRRFRTEADLLGRLNNEGIARIYEADTYRTPDPDAEPVPFFAMEFIEAARPITDYAASKGLDINARLKLIALVCDAVDHGHRAGVLHRDLKPENIVVDANGRVKVIDFGIARVTEPELAATRITEVGQLVGTLQYMSPEQFDGYSDRLTNSSDIYSLGIILYELICGRLPYDVTGKTVIQAAHVVRQSTPPAPSKVDPRFRGDIETIILKAISKEAPRRYQHASEMAHDIRNFLTGEPIRARQDSMVYVVKKRTAQWAGRKPEVAIFGIVTLIVAITLIILELPGVLSRPLADSWVYNRLAAGPIPKPLAGDWQHIRVVQYSNQTDFEALAAELGLQGVQNFKPDPDPNVTKDYHESWRRVHGAVMQRLAAAGIRVMAWDLQFLTSTEYDDDFVSGVQALGQLKPPVDVVLARKTWRPIVEDDPYINPNLAPYVKPGTAAMDIGEADSPTVWSVDLAMQHANTGGVGSLALLTYAYANFPGLKPVPDFGRAKDAFTLRIDKPETGIPSGVAPSIEVTSIEDILIDDPDWDLREKSTVAAFILHMPDDGVLDRATIPYEDLVRKSPRELRDVLGGKALMIGQKRKLDMVRYPDDRSIPGTYSNAAAVEFISRGVCIHALAGSQRAAAVGVFCILGVLLAIAAMKSLRRLALLITVGLALAVAGSIFMYRESALLFNPLVPALGMIVTAVLTRQVLRLYQRQSATSRGEVIA